MDVEIEVAYGTDQQQFLQKITVKQGCTAREAVMCSDIGSRFPEADVHAPLGIFGKKTADNTVLRPGDRVELYRPLIIDPKEARRRRVAEKE